MNASLVHSEGCDSLAQSFVVVDSVQYHLQSWKKKKITVKVHVQQAFDKLSSFNEILLVNNQEQTSKVSKHWHSVFILLGAFTSIKSLVKFYLSYLFFFEFTIKKLRCSLEAIYFSRLSWKCPTKLKFKGNWNNTHKCLAAKLWNT